MGLAFSEAAGVVAARPVLVPGETNPSIEQSTLTLDSNAPCVEWTIVAEDPKTEESEAAGVVVARPVLVPGETIPSIEQSTLTPDSNAPDVINAIMRSNTPSAEVAEEPKVVESKVTGIAAASPVADTGEINTSVEQSTSTVAQNPPIIAVPIITLPTAEVADNDVNTFRTGSPVNSEYCLDNDHLNSISIVADTTEGVPLPVLESTLSRQSEVELAAAGLFNDHDSLIDVTVAFEQWNPYSMLSDDSDGGG